MQHSYQQQHFSLLRAVCSGCCVPYLCCHTDEEKERPPATELPLSLLLEGSQDGKYLLVLDEREAQHPFTTLLGFFTGIVLKAVKLSAQPESVICLYGDNVVSIPLLHGKWQDEENWRFSEPFAFASREKILRCWIMIMYVIWGVKKEKEVNFGSFSLGSFPFKATVLICFCLFYQFYALYVTVKPYISLK